jgi:hypothetical protein
MKLTQAQVKDVYHYIVEQNPEFVRMMAQAAIENSLEIQADMWIDDNTGAQGGLRALPNVESAKAMSKSFTDDMIADFKKSFDEAVDTRNVVAHHRLHVTVSFDPVE